MRGLKQVASGWGSGPNTANVYLYPNEPRDVDPCDVGGYVSDAIGRGFDQLAGDAIGSYYAYMCTPGEFPGFDGKETGYSVLGREFVDWLGDESPYWPAQPGCHMLVAEEYRDSGGPHGTDYDRPIDADSLDDCAFNEAHAMVLGLRDPERRRARHQNFAVQEPLHTFLPEEYLAAETDLLHPESPDEHQLGSLTDDGEATPMITGHAGPDDWYYDVSGRGTCGSDGRWSGGHSPTLTPCTREAVRLAAEEAERRARRSSARETDVE